MIVRPIVISSATNEPKRIEGRWKAFAVFRSEPGITGITVLRAATGPPVRKY